MALIAEEVVEEWLNRQGFFTIRGIKLGNHEIDILAIRPRRGGKPECRHIEVHVAVKPVSYITSVPREVRKATGRAANNATRRGTRELRKGVKEWVDKKFKDGGKQDLRQRLCRGTWTRELVVHKVRHPEELRALKKAGIKITNFEQVVQDLHSSQTQVASAAGKDLLELITIASQSVTPATCA